MRLKDVIILALCLANAWQALRIAELERDIRVLRAHETSCEELSRKLARLLASEEPPEVPRASLHLPLAPAP